jgi:parallel beta-helix repeat protein
MLYNIKKMAAIIALMLALSLAIVFLLELGAVKEEEITICIRADGTVEGTDRIQRDGFVYTFTDDSTCNKGDDSGVCIVIERSNVVINGNGCALRGSGLGTGFYWATGINNVTIQNIIINKLSRGIQLVSSSNNTITGTTLINLRFSGIELKNSSDNNHIFGNQIDNNKENHFSRGIYIESSSKNSIHENTVKNNRNAIELDRASSENRVYENIVKSNSYGVVLDGSAIVGALRLNNVSGNQIINNSIGIQIESHSENNTLTKNYIANNGKGICLRYGSERNTFFGNEISDNTIGISFEKSSSNLLRNNTLNNNADTINIDDAPLSYLINDVDESNTIDSKPIYYWVNQQNKTIPSNAGYVALVNCTNVTVQNLNLTDNIRGILVAHTTNSTITKNNITNNEEGILLHYSSHNSINENNIAANAIGIKLGENSSHNSISGNRIKTSTSAAIDLFVAYNNSITGNNIIDNNCGIGFWWSPNNIIYHNNFINNTKQVNDIYLVPNTALSEQPSTNIWDNGSEGNYWSNYTGQDNNGDGIGDTTHIIHENNQDNYPLTKPVIIPAFP